MQHAACALKISMDVNTIVYVKEQMGHSSIQITADSTDT
jgi:hypothetical protein